MLCCGCTSTDFLISIRLTSLALWQSNDCPSASKATLMNMDKYFMWIHYERLHNHNKAKHNKTVCIFLGIYSMHKITHTFLTLISCDTYTSLTPSCFPKLLAITRDTTLQQEIAMPGSAWSTFKSVVQDTFEYSPRYLHIKTTSWPIAGVLIGLFFDPRLQTV